MEQSSTSIDPNDLLIFARVAELGSFSRAAEKLGLPKSSVSRRLAALEQRLGERLLLRTTRRQTLTELGTQLLEHAQQVAQEVQAVQDLSEHRQTTPSGRLRVSMPADLTTLLLAKHLADFAAQYPHIALEIDLSARRVDLLGEGFDVVLRAGILTDDNLLAARKLCDLSSSLYAAPSYLARHGEPHTPADLQQHHTVRLQRSSGELAPWPLRCGEQTEHASPPCRLSANAPDLVLRWVVAGCGIGSVPNALARRDWEQGALVRVLPDWQLPTVPISAVFPGRKLMPPKTRVFIDMLHRAFSENGL
ncbi:LysR family transcriptional regulator [Curvibacter sp. CHRR-16]|uniref:LysR family transcriptional regulator n=1 Tax=Curvibacter sp. CHRR-16 TaxID=2835872 RepID=UPI001BDB12D8|nr:LysR family transcriptional regulator [Curvibacter sp. CHRR-16]MBT0569732.1 LysR family transcriptional regulator [Curvibacter sp. CHRR-16]